ncbi:putative peptidase S10, serine carboxypeptidase, alpha/Beta hydrolase [Lupinus albus]|uniref:Putative peptidase S10, serine carboxypeptidase, alpha/Beta hydrolase n=1 Tax=Lupinus albus TaxID=3870 RepID=A0A6A4QLP5_LUPAL|nr:putative peptidase S10, serine carboxypeptidase, alpha/Beta hydrolase [Lupinus albus]
MLEEGHSDNKGLFYFIKTMSFSMKCFMWLHFVISMILILSKPTISSHIIRSLPGFPGNLPFKLETGYIGVGENEVVQLFYYFVESEGNPTEDPLLLWLSGGPGCSGLCGLFFEIGPLKFNMVKYNGSLPTFSLNQHSWTKVSSIIFIDAPVGSGFAYSRTMSGYKTTDKIHAQHCHSFMRKWLVYHPKFIGNQFYIGGDSYGGIPVPILTKYISDGNFGYMAGNPATDPNFDWNAKIPFVHRMALISDELYKSAKMTCRGEYVNVKKDNLACQNDLQAITECIRNINEEHVLEPNCPTDVFLFNYSTADQKAREEFQRMVLHAPLKILQFGCRNYENLLLHEWANNVHVQKALHVRLGHVAVWIRCNRSIIHTNDVPSVLSYHRYLRTKHIRALIYSGDHDMQMSYLGTLRWINSLNSTIVEEWKPWIVRDQIAGYVQEYSNYITFATVKAYVEKACWEGAGHTAPEYKRKECFEMFKRWISHKPLSFLDPKFPFSNEHNANLTSIKDNLGNELSLL